VDGSYFRLDSFTIADVVKDTTVDAQFGTYSEMDIATLNTRINYLENSLVDDGEVDFRETSQTIYSMDNAVVIKGGTGYVAGDIIYTNAQLIRGDRRGVLTVGSTDLNGAITGVIVNNPGTYFNDITGDYDVIGGTGIGASIALTTTGRDGTTLASKAAIQNHRVNVLYDETSDYNGYFYIYNKDIAQWQRSGESHVEERDFQIDRIKNYEIEDKAISTGKIVDKNITDSKIADVIATGIAEDIIKFTEIDNMTFGEFKQKLKNKINGIITNKQNNITGGTTGQVLTKNSNNDGDFIWTTQEPGIIKVGEYTINNGDTELIIPLDNTKTYKIVLEYMRSSADTGSPYLCLRFGDDNSFKDTGYNTDSERLFTGGYAWGYDAHNNYNCILLNYSDCYVYNTRAFSGELDIPASRGTTFPKINGKTNSVRPSDNCLTTSIFNGVLSTINYNYTRIRLFLSANNFVEGKVKVYQLS
jgi:hypothetical protein